MTMLTLRSPLNASVRLFLAYCRKARREFRGKAIRALIGFLEEIIVGETGSTGLQDVDDPFVGLIN